MFLASRCCAQFANTNTNESIRNNLLSIIKLADRESLPLAPHLSCCSVNHSATPPHYNDIRRRSLGNVIWLAWRYFLNYAILYFLVRLKFLVSLLMLTNFLYKFISIS